MIVTSNLFVCVVGDSYGTLFPGAATPTSVVEWEFETARAQSQLEIMTFVRAGAGAAPDVRQQQFVERITRFREGVWAKHFTDVVELGVQVRESVGGWLSEYWARTQARKEDLARRYRWPLRMVAGTVTASVVTAVVGGVLTPAALAALCVVTGALIGACFVLELLLE